MFGSQKRKKKIRNIPVFQHLENNAYSVKYKADVKTIAVLAGIIQQELVNSKFK